MRFWPQCSTGTEKRGIPVPRWMQGVFLLAACLAVGGCASQAVGSLEFRDLKKRTLAAEDAKSGRRSRLEALFKEVESGTLALAGKSYPTNEHEIAACESFQASLLEMKKEVGLDVVVCVLSEASGRGFVRQAAYQCLLEGAENYTIEDVEMLSKAVVLSYKDSPLYFGSGGEDRWAVPDWRLRVRLVGYIWSILGLEAEQLPKGLEPVATSGKVARMWLKEVLTMALTIPANAEKKDVIERALASLGEWPTVSGEPGRSPLRK